jgi:hypothetical protein
MQRISELESQIRDFINRPRKQQSLFRDLADWNKLCSSLDVIGDTELALEAYLENIRAPAADGELYLILYGVLQILFVQQDAVKHLAEALGLQYTSDPLLREIRKVRHDSVGHPTERGHGKGRTFNFITRISMSRGGFTLMTTYPDRDSTFFQVDVPQLISTQRSILRRVLIEVIDKLKEEEMEHRERFRDEKLVDVFPPTLNYYYEKIAETIHGGAPVEFGAGIVGLVIGVVSDFKNALDTRGILDAYNVSYDLELVEYPLAELRRYFDSPDESKLNERDAYIFLVFIRHQIDSLIRFATELDEEYVSEP